MPPIRRHRPSGSSATRRSHVAGQTRPRDLETADAEAADVETTDIETTDVEPSLPKSVATEADSDEVDPIEVAASEVTVPAGEQQVVVRVVSTGVEELPGSRTRRPLRQRARRVAPAAPSVALSPEQVEAVEAEAIEAEFIEAEEFAGAGLGASTADSGEPVFSQHAPSSVVDLSKALEAAEGDFPYEVVGPEHPLFDGSDPEAEDASASRVQVFPGGEAPVENPAPAALSAASVPAGSPAAPPRTPRTWQLALLAGMVVAALAFAVLAVLAAVTPSEPLNRAFVDSDLTTKVEVEAKTALEKLYSYSPADFDTANDAAAGVLAEPLRTEFLSDVDVRRDVLVRDQVTAKATAQSGGVMEVFTDGDVDTAKVAVHLRIRGDRAGVPVEETDLRFVVDLELLDGRWLVTQLLST